jgi:hypothetical protein
MTPSDGLILPCNSFLIRDVHHFGLVVACSEVTRVAFAFSRHLTDAFLSEAEQLRNLRDIGCMTSAVPNYLDVLQAFLVDPLLCPPASVIVQAPNAIEISWVERLVAQQYSVCRAVSHSVETHFPGIDGNHCPVFSRSLDLFQLLSHHHVPVVQWRERAKMHILPPVAMQLAARLQSISQDEGDIGQFRQMKYARAIPYQACGSRPCNSRRV